MFELIWGPPGGIEEPLQERVAVGSAAELRQSLDRLEQLGSAGDPLVIRLVHAGHGQLGIGLGAEVSFATFEASDGKPPYYLSRGSAGGTEPLVFFLDGEWTELPPEAAIPVDDAVAAMITFFSEGKRPENITWVET